MPAPDARRLRVLVVARWYPSHDQPGRGSFVADLVRALSAAGTDLVVASFEATHVRGVSDTRPERGAAAAAMLGPALARGTALNRPARWGVPGVSVARLPVFLDGERRRPGDVVAAHDAALRPFGRALAGRWPFDVIHAHTGLIDGVVAGRLADELGVPLLTTEHSSTAAAELEDPEAAELYRGLLGGRPDRQLVAVSQSLASDVAFALGLAPHAIGVLPNAVPIDGFPLADPAGRERDELIYIGSRKATKGIERLLRAFALVLADRPAARLRLIGTPGAPDEEARWQSMALELLPPDAVSIEPPVRREEVATAMQRAALFVHPSPRETFGMVVAEALASGLPVATTPSGGADEIVGPDGRFGTVAAGLEPEDLAAAILLGLSRSGDADGAAMRGHVEAQYASPAVAARTIETYEALGAVATSGAAPEPDEAPFLPSIVVAMARGQGVQRVAQLPLELANRLTVVTMPAAPSGLNAAALPAFGRWLELDVERFVRVELAAAGELRHVRRGPLAFLDENHNRGVQERRGDVEARREEIRAAGIGAALRDALAASPGGSTAGGRGLIVALDADDALLAHGALGDGVELAPGGLRWLADRWDAARSAAEAARDDASADPN